MLDCTTDRYDDLYAKWVGRDNTLLRLGQYVNGEALLDLCGGTGQTTREALLYYFEEKPEDPPRRRLIAPKFGAPMPNITLFDLNPRLDSWAELPLRYRYLRAVRGRAEGVDQHFPGEHFDLVVIRQALGYLDIERTFEALSRVMQPGARLVFNSFIDPIEGGVKRYSLKGYEYEGQKFIEAHLSLFDRVLHLQAKVSWVPGADVTLFKYHSPEDIQAALAPWFSWDVHQEDRSTRWLCIRQPFSYQEEYLRLLAQMDRIRRKHKGADSPEEEAIIDSLDKVWWLCTEEQRSNLNRGTGA